MGVTDFVLTCGSEPVVGAVCTAVVGFARTGRALDARLCSRGQILRRMLRWRHTIVIL